MEALSLDELYVGKYIGPNKVIGVVPLTLRTPSGGIVLKFTVEKFVQEQSIRFDVLVPEKAISLMVKAESVDYTAMITEQTNELVEKVVDIMLEYNFDMGFLDLFTRSLTTSLNLRFARAKNFLWQGTDTNFAPGYDPDNDVSLLQVMDVISKIPQPVKTDESES